MFVKRFRVLRGHEDVYDFMLSIGGWVWQTGSGPLCIYAFLANENVKLYQEI